MRPTSRSYVAHGDPWSSNAMNFYQAQTIDEYFELFHGITILLLIDFSLLQQPQKWSIAKLLFVSFICLFPHVPTRCAAKRKKRRREKAITKQNSILLYSTSNQPTASLLAIYVYITSWFNLLILVSFYCRLLFCSLDCSFLFFSIFFQSKSPTFQVHAQPLFIYVQISKA